MLNISKKMKIHLKNITIIGLQFICAFLFLFSAYTKWIAPRYFEILLMGQIEFITPSWASILSRFIIGLEFSIGVLFLFRLFLRKVALFSFWMLIVFTLFLIRQVILGNDENCGCFGEMIKMSPLESILKNIGTLIIIFILYKISKKYTLKKKSYFLALGVASFIIALQFFLLPIKNNDSFPFSKFTNFKNGEKMEKIDLISKKAIVAVFNLDCNHCQDAAKMLGELKKTYSQIPDIFVLFFSEGETTIEEFNKITYTNFPYVLIDENAFFDLIGKSPPRLYLLEKGTIIKTLDSNFKENIKSHYFLK